MSLINQTVRFKNYDANDKNNPYGFVSDLIQLAPANSSLTGTGTPAPETGKNGDIFYSDDGQIYKKDNGEWTTLYSIPGTPSSGNEAINNIANVGTGIGVFKQKVDNNAYFKNLVASTNIQLNEVGDDIYISSTDNIGAVINDSVISATEAWSSQKINNEITSLPEAKGVVAGSNKISVVEGADFTVDLVNSNVDILSLANAPSSNVVGVFDGQLLTNKVYQAQDGAVSAPSHSFTSASSSGMWYDPATTAVKVSTGGIEYLSVSSAGVNSVVQVRGQGNGSLPALSFSNKTNSGLNNQGNQLNLIANGTVGLEISETAVNAPSGVQYTSRNGDETAPDYSFDQNNDMGMYRVANNQLGFSVQGVSKLEIGSNIKPLVPIETNLGSPASPIIHSTGASDSGIFFNAGGEVCISESANQKIAFTASETLHLQKNRYPDGSVSSPSVSFGTGSDGFYYSPGTVNTLYMAFGTGSAFFNENEIGVSANNRFRPGTDGIMNLGNSNRRWNTVFATNGTINTSDARMKKEVRGIELSTEFVKRLNPVSFVWRPTVNVEDPSIPGSKTLPDVIHSRRHLGLVAQEVEIAIRESGCDLSTCDIIDNDSHVEEGGADIYSIRYHTLIPVLIKTIQELEARITTLENK